MPNFSNSQILQFLINKLSQVVFVVFYNKTSVVFEDNSDNSKQHFRPFSPFPPFSGYKNFLFRKISEKIEIPEKNVFSSFSNSFVIKKTTFSCVFVMKRPHFLPIPFFSEKFSIGKRYLKNVKSTFIGLCEKIKTANFPRGKGVTIENKAVTLPPNHKRSSMYNP